MASTAFTPPNNPVGGAFTKGVAVTKSDATVLPITRGLWVTGTGDVVVQFAADDTAITFAAVPANTLLPFCVVKVKAATSATGIIALY